MKRILISIFVICLLVLSANAGQKHKKLADKMTGEYGITKDGMFFMSERYLEQERKKYKEKKNFSFMISVAPSFVNTQLPDYPPHWAKPGLDSLSSARLKENRFGIMDSDFGLIDYYDRKHNQAEAWYPWYVHAWGFYSELWSTNYLGDKIIAVIFALIFLVLLLLLSTGFWSITHLGHEDHTYEDTDDTEEIAKLRSSLT